jgi:hypothetical protein
LQDIGHPQQLFMFELINAEQFIQLLIKYGRSILLAHNHIVIFQFL